MAKEIPEYLKSLPIREAIDSNLQVGDALILYRTVNGKRQATVARELGVTRAAMGFWEYGKREPPSFIALAVSIWLENYKKFLQS
jgi:DNA-binding XRE family transcriptional regulator